MGLSTRSGVVLVMAALASACGTGAPDGVAAPGLDGAPREVTLEAPALPTTTERADDGMVDGATPEPSSTAESSVASTTTSTTGTTETVEEVAPTTTADAADASTTTVDDPFLRRGDEGPEVRSLQQRLIALEYLATGGDTGVFDAATADALIDFQAQYGLVVDGIFGPESDRALNAAAASVTDG